MYMFVFILLLFNFSLYQAKNFGTPGYGQSKSQKTFTDYSSPVFVEPKRIKRQTFNNYNAGGVDVLNIGNGRGKTNFVVLDESRDFNNRPIYKNTGTGRYQPPVNPYASYPEPGYSRDADKSDPSLFNNQNNKRVTNANNVGNRLGSAPFQESDNSYPDIYGAQHNKGVKSTDNVGNRFGNEDRRRFDNTYTIEGFTQNTGTTKHKQKPGATITNISNGNGNRKQTNIPPVHHPLNSNSNSNPPTRFKGVNNGQGSQIYIRFGQGVGNTNKIFVNN